MHRNHEAVNFILKYNYFKKDWSGQFYKHHQNYNYFVLTTFKSQSNYKLCIKIQFLSIFIISNKTKEC